MVGIKDSDMKKVIIIFAIAALMSGCGMLRHNIESSSDSLVHYVTRIQHDTVQQFAHDSVYLSVISKNDTVFVNKYKERIIYKNKATVKADTVIVYKNHDVYINKETTKNKIPKWCWILLASDVIILVFFVIKLYVKWKTII